MSNQIRRPGMLPPMATRVSLLAQAPGIVLSWPLHPRIEALVAATAMFVLAILLNIAAATSFSRRGIGIVPFTEAPELAQGGVFRLTRNPMYLGLVLFSASLWLGTGVWYNFFAPLLLAVWLHLFYVLREEAFLRERFGNTYRDYCRRVPRWL